MSTKDEKSGTRKWKETQKKNDILAELIEIEPTIMK